MLREVKDPYEIGARLVKPPFNGICLKCGTLDVEKMLLDKKDKHHMFLRVKGKSCHQLLRLYGFIFDQWVKTGFAFDEFILIRDGNKYYAEVTYTNPKDARLRVSVVTNKRIVTGYENEKNNENHHPLFGDKRGA